MTNISINDNRRTVPLDSIPTEGKQITKAVEDQTTTTEKEADIVKNFIILLMQIYQPQESTSTNSDTHSEGGGTQTGGQGSQHLQSFFVGKSAEIANKMNKGQRDEATQDIEALISNLPISQENKDLLSSMNKMLAKDSTSQDQVDSSIDYRKLVSRD